MLSVKSVGQNRKKLSAIGRFCWTNNFFHSGIIGPQRSGLSTLPGDVRLSGSEGLVCYQMSRKGEAW